MQSEAPRPALSGRLHPLTVVVAIQKEIRWFLLPLVALVLFGTGNAFLFVPALVGAVIAFMQGVVRYYVFSYRLDDTELVIRDGIFARTERHIPLERVQDVQVEQGPVHRLLGLVDVRIQTAGGGDEPEASFSAISAAEAETLRDAVVTRTRRPVATDAPAGEVEHVRPVPPAVIRKLSTRDVIVAGLTSSVIGPFLASVGGLWAFADDVLPDTVYRAIGERLSDAVAGFAAEGFSMRAILYAAAGLVVALALAMAVSGIVSLLLFHGFTLSLDDGNLNRAYGLLTRRASSLPRRRIQVVEIEQGPVRRLLRLAAVRADTAGEAGTEPGKDTGGRDVIVPIMREGEVEDLLPALFPDIEPAPAEWRRVSRRIITRMTVLGSLPLVGVTIAMVTFQGAPVGLWPLALVPLAYAASVMSYRAMGYTLGERYLRTRQGWIGRSTHVVPIRNVQVVVVRQSPIERRTGLATVLVDTAGQAFTGGGPQIRALPLAEARELAAALAHGAARIRYRR